MVCIIELLHQRVVCIIELFASSNCLHHRIVCIIELFASSNCYINESFASSNCWHHRIVGIIELLHLRMVCIIKLFASSNCYINESFASSNCLHHRIVCIIELLASSNCYIYEWFASSNCLHHRIVTSTSRLHHRIVCIIELFTPMNGLHHRILCIMHGLICQRVEREGVTPQRIKCAGLRQIDASCMDVIIIQFCASSSSSWRPASGNNAVCQQLQLQYMVHSSNVKIGCLFVITCSVGPQRNGFFMVVTSGTRTSNRRTTMKTHQSHHHPMSSPTSLSRLCMMFHHIRVHHLSNPGLMYLFFAVVPAHIVESSYNVVVPKNRKCEQETNFYVNFLLVVVALNKLVARGST